jgi:hypothetical protein
MKKTRSKKSRDTVPLIRGKALATPDHPFFEPRSLTMTFTKKERKQRKKERKRKDKRKDKRKKEIKKERKKERKKKKRKKERKKILDSLSSTSSHEKLCTSIEEFRIRKYFLWIRIRIRESGRIHIRIIAENFCGH